MTRRVVAYGFSNTRELIERLNEVLDYRTEIVPRGSEMYVKDANGNELTILEVVESELTDGSKTYDVVLRSTN